MVHVEYEFDWLELQPIILKLEAQGYVTRTFRRLDPARQGAIIEAIFKEAAEAGPASMNIKAVAERAGVAVGSLYMYFNNRDGMLNFAVELCVRYVREALESYIPFLVELPVMEGLRSYLVGGMQWSQTQAAFLGLFARAAYQGDPLMAERMVTPVSEVLQEMVREILVKAQQRGEIRSDLNAEAATRAIYAWMIALADSQLLPYLNNYFRVSDEKISFEPVMETALQMIAHSILAEELH